MKRRHILLSAVTTAGLAFANISIGKKQTNAASNQSFAAYNSLQVENEGARLYTEMEGTGKPVLLLHGGLGHMGWFSQLRSYLSKKHQVILVDTRGCGRSSMGANGISYGQQERDVLAILQRLNIPRCAVIGFSDGGIVGMRLAARSNSPISKLVTIGSRWRAAHGQGMWQEFDRWSRASLSSYC